MRQRRLLTTSAPLFHPPPPSPIPRRGALPTKRPIPHVRHTIAISSAKGGVGKSTLAANLALTFSRHNLRTGILDCDIFGPSVPTLFGLEGRRELPDVTDTGKLVPLRAWGVGGMSMGYLLGKGKEGTEKEGVGKGEEDGPVAWRGAMVQKALQQLLFEVEWWGGGEAGGGLDVLVLDMPPGTGDVQLTIGQSVVLSGAVVVSTPQDVALRDAVRGVKMFGAMGIEVLGLVRNMSVFVCPGCGKETRVFEHGGEGGLEGRLEGMGVELLGEVPLDPQICVDADNGKPTVVAEEGRGRRRVNTGYYEGIARRVAEKVGLDWR